MPVPKNKEDLLAAIATNYKKLAKEFESISEEASLQQNLQGHAKGSQMSIQDLLAYLIGWGELVLKWNRKIEQKQMVHFPEDGFKWTELGTLAQKFYMDYAELEYQELLLRLDKVVEKIITLIQSKSNSDLYQSQWYKHYPMGRMIQLNTSSPYKNARIRIRKWKKEMNLS
ncbi:MAG: ClbS/DfsB family four-helix bundle protein [Bacteroidota bacterium]